MTLGQRMVKRTFDMMVSLILILLLSPLLVTVSALILLDSRGGVLFRQERPGKNGVHFTMYKFRSMVPNAQNMGAGIYFSGSDDPRITRVGRLLRRTSIDELPQLFNILKGDMSIIGPRPSLVQQLSRFNKKQQKRFTVKPGVTGWAQVNGRNNLSWSQRAEYDVWYIENYSYWLDIKILFKTIQVVFTGSGIRYNQKPEEVEDFSKGGEDTK